MRFVLVHARERLRQRATAESGAAAVEFAILLPLIVMLMFGMLTGGLAWNRKQNLTQAAREAARYGATLPATSGWADSVSQRAIDASFAELGGSVPTSDYYVCVAYIGTTGTQYKEVGTPATARVGPGCFSDGKTDARVQVRVERKADLEFVLGRVTGMALRSDAVTRHEVTQ